MAAKLWHDIRFANVLSPILHTRVSATSYVNMCVSSQLTLIDAPLLASVEPGSAGWQLFAWSSMPSLER